jgi:hypothetical protein
METCKLLEKVVMLRRKYTDPMRVPSKSALAHKGYYTMLKTYGKLYFLTETLRNKDVAMEFSRARCVWYWKINVPIPELVALVNAIENAEKEYEAVPKFSTALTIIEV